MSQGPFQAVVLLTTIKYLNTGRQAKEMFNSSVIKLNDLVLNKAELGLKFTLENV